MCWLLSPLPDANTSLLQLKRPTLRAGWRALLSIALASTVFAAGAAAAAELCRNPDFETDLNGWGGYGKAQLTQASGGRASGFALQLKGTSTSSFGADDLPNSVPVVAAKGSTYRFSAWVRSDASKGKVKIRVYELAGTKQVGSTFYSAQVPLTSTWFELVAIYVVRQAGTALSMRITDAPVAKGESFQVDDVSIQLLGSSNLPPTARLSAGPSSGVAPLAVTLDASGSSDPDGTIASCTFDFGDGNVVGPQTDSHAAHTYAAGNYTASVTITDNSGAISTATTRVSVSATPTDNVPPTASLSVAPSSGTAPLAVTADASASSDSDGTIASYTFDFGDGSPPVKTTAPNARAQHIYSAGTYTVKVTVTDNRGTTSSPANGSVSVSPGPAAASPVAVYVGYYDTHHSGNPQPKPNPWRGSPNVVFVGKPDGSGGGWDTSALRLDNLTGAPVTGVQVSVSMGSKTFSLWGTNSVPAGQSLILAQTGSGNFDGSDVNPAGCPGCNPADCTRRYQPTIPVVHVTIGGVKTDYFDTQQVLNTKGVDAAGCPYTGSRNDESHAWQQVGTSLAAALASGSEDDAQPEAIAPTEGGALWLASYPNPNHGELGIRFTTPVSGPVKLGVYDVAGRLVRSCLDGIRTPGTYAERVDLSGAAPGIYFCSLSTRNGAIKSTFVLVR